MERLTFEGNFCDIAQCRELPCKYDGNCTQKEVWERLKAYEDAALSPQAASLPAGILCGKPEQTGLLFAPRVCALPRGPHKICREYGQAGENAHSGEPVPAIAKTKAAFEINHGKTVAIICILRYHIIKREVFGFS